MNNRETFSMSKKQAVYASYNGKCAICGKYVKFKRMSIDHIVPYSRGGTDDLNNLQLTCKSCNSVKSYLTMQELYEKILDISKFHAWDMMKTAISRRENA